MSHQLDVRRGVQRPVTRTPGVASRHSLSFGVHYDPGNTHVGRLVAHNHDRLEPGHGYPDHPHRDVEIVTWLLAGRLDHADSTGRRAQLTPGSVQLLGAGSGVRHSEVAGPDPTELVQMWLPADPEGGPPRFAQRDLTAELDAGGLVVAASGRDGPGLALHAVVPAEVLAWQLDG